VKNINTILAVGAVTAVCGGAEAAVVAYWNFNSLTAAPGTATVISADQGAGTIFANGSNGSSAWTSLNSNPQLTAFLGVSLNALGADPAGNALAPANSSSNGQSITISFDMTGLANLSVSYATRGTSTGFNSQSWAASVDGVNFVNIQQVTGTTSSTWSVVTLPTITMLDGSAVAFLRITFQGASSTSGNNRIDNLQLNADVIPAPGAMALLGVAGLIGSRRRR